jgi:hypothetical protein
MSIDQFKNIYLENFFKNLINLRSFDEIKKSCGDQIETFLKNTLRQQTWNSDECMFINVALLFTPTLLEKRMGKKRGAGVVERIDIDKTISELLIRRHKFQEIYRHSSIGKSCGINVKPVEWLEEFQNTDVAFNEEFSKRINLAYFRLEIEDFNKDLIKNLDRDMGQVNPGNLLPIERVVTIIQKKQGDFFSEYLLADDCANGLLGAYIKCAQHNIHPDRQTSLRAVGAIKADLKSGCGDVPSNYDFSYKGLVRLIGPNIPDCHSVSKLKTDSITVKRGSLFFYQPSRADIILGIKNWLRVDQDVEIKITDLFFIEDEVLAYLNSLDIENHSKCKDDEMINSSVSNAAAVENTPLKGKAKINFAGPGYSQNEEDLKMISSNATHSDTSRKGAKATNAKHDAPREKAIKTAASYWGNKALTMHDVAEAISLSFKELKIKNPHTGTEYSTGTIKKWIKDSAPLEKRKPGRPPKQK